MRAPIMTAVVTEITITIIVVVIISTVTITVITITMACYVMSATHWNEGADMDTRTN